MNLDLLGRFVVVGLIIGLRLYFIYKRARNAPRRSPRVRRVEVIVAICLWSFIAVAVTILLLVYR